MGYHIGPEIVVVGGAAPAAAGAAEESLSIHHVVYSNYMFTAYLRPSMTELVYKVHKEFET